MSTIATTLTDDRTALLAAIREAPDDDAPRLIYADWLDEHVSYSECPYCKDAKFDTGDYGGPMQAKMGDYVHSKCLCRGSRQVSNLFAERAEFISVQVKLARFGPNSKILCDMQQMKRSRELLQLHGERWAMEELVRPAFVGPIFTENPDVHQTTIPLLSGVGTGGASIKWHWSRGFIEGIELATETLMGWELVCPRCNGTRCNGTGRVGGCRDALRATLLPLKRVVLTDKRAGVGPPNFFVRGERRHNSPYHESHHLPDGIFDLLKGGRHQKADDFIFYYFNPENTALAALAEAAAEYVRREMKE